MNAGGTCRIGTAALVSVAIAACAVPRHVESAPAKPDTFVCSVLAADGLGFVLYEADSAHAEFAAVRQTPGRAAATPGRSCPQRSSA